MLLRLDKILCHAGQGSRSDMRAAIIKGRVKVNDTPVFDPAKKFDASKENITLNDKDIDFLPHYTYILHKPTGVITATEDKSQPTVFNLFDERVCRLGLSPVGRLDKDTTGLLLLTTDGDLLHKLTSPRSKIDKVYRVKVKGILKQEHIVQVAKGLVLGNGLNCLPAKLEILSSNENESEALLTISEGKYHQVKRMMASLGCAVIMLHRESLGALSLPDNLAVGQWRRLTEEQELASLRR